jgi:hypothetical protein
MGLILDARDVHSNTLFGSEQRCFLVDMLCGPGRTGQILHATMGLHDETSEIESSTEAV